MAEKQPEILKTVLNDYEQDKTVHDQNLPVFDRRYKAYRGLIDEKSVAFEWTPKYHPRWVWQQIETMVANLVDANPKWKIHVHPQLADPEREEELREGALANQLLLEHQLTLDKWAEKQREFDLQGLILGVTASKQSWAYREGKRRYWENYSEPVLGGMFGLQIGSVERQRDMESVEVLRDDPTSEVVDVRHLIFQRGATKLQNSDRLTHRCYYSYDQLKRQECRVNGGKFHEGECEPGRYYHNVDELKNEGGVTTDRFQREQDIHGERPHQDDIEVIEQYRREGDTLRIVCVGNSKVLLSNRESPYWFDHLDHPFPFVVCSGSPDLFKIQGMSMVEMVSEIQEMLWTIGGQRLTNLEYVNNAIAMVADDLEDQELIFAPGEQWLLPRPVEESVKMWAPDVRAAQVSLEAESMLKADLQGIMGVLPGLGGVDQITDQQTATAVSITTSLAQKRIAHQRQQFLWAKGRVGEQWTALNQQYVREPRKVPVIGEDGMEYFKELRPELLQGMFLFETEMVEESLNREQRRAEAQAKLQTLAQIAPVAAMSQAPINFRAAIEDYLDTFDITDKERYFSAQAPAGLPGQVPQAAPPGNGITNAALAAGPTSPSNETSMSPEAAMQQMLAQTGPQGG